MHYNAPPDPGRTHNYQNPFFSCRGFYMHCNAPPDPVRTHNYPDPEKHTCKHVWSLVALPSPNTHTGHTRGHKGEQRRGGPEREKVGIGKTGKSKGSWREDRWLQDRFRKSKGSWREMVGGRRGGGVEVQGPFFQVSLTPFVCPPYLSKPLHQRAV
jgi:hypothetical protein